MQSKTAFIDDQLVARNFNTGDVVRKSGLRGFLLSPYVGRVLYSNSDTGVVVVQWPWGSEQEWATEICHDASGDFPPPVHDQSYHTWESERNINSKDVVKKDEKWRKSLSSRIVDMYEKHTLPVYHAACKEMHNDVSEIDAYIKLSDTFSEKYGDDLVRRTVANLYGVARTAIYWKDQKRQYRVTQQEKKTGILQCPRCHGILKPRVFTFGKRTLLCKNCGFSIYPRDIKH